MLRSTILSVTVLCIVQLASANTGYGVPEADEYSPPSTYGQNDNEYAPPSRYEHKPYGSYGNGPVYGDDDYSRERDHHRSCGDLRSLHINGQKTFKVHVKDTLERRGRSYVQLSCKNNNKAYALVAEKRGSTFNLGGVEYTDKILLAYGFNLDFVAECHSRGRTVGRDVEGEKHSFRKVSCVQLAHPTSP